MASFDEYSKTSALFKKREFETLIGNDEKRNSPQSKPFDSEIVEEFEEDSNIRCRNRKLERFNAEMKTLNQEMDIVVYPTNKQGRARRKASRHQTHVRRMKRKILEEEDSVKHAVIVDDEMVEDANGVSKRKRKMRGSMVALEMGDGALKSLFVDEDEINNEAKVYNDEVEVTEDFENFGVEINTIETEQEDEDENDEENQLEKNELKKSLFHEVYKDGLAINKQNKQVPMQQQLPEKKSFVNENEDNVKNQTESYHSERKSNGLSEIDVRPPTQTTEEIRQYKNILNSSGKRVKRKVFRLRDFTSDRLAQRHGEALGAHAQGKQRKAVEKLSEVAEQAPAAPQIYSSLGMVYESLLEDASIQKKRKECDINPSQNDPMADISARLELGKKTYGSYHVAALLCKKDYTLWVRAADAACDIVEMYNEAMCAFPSALSNNRAEKLKWLNEAKNDYQSADNLHPPGISVPAKLASVQMQLGNLSEALTILTDLRNNALRSIRSTPDPNRIYWRKSDWNPRSELERSHTAWLLYADLMLRIGHECHQWNLKRRQNNNYMFKRWLRKYSKTFDWKERRLQALCLSLEAACGSEVCTNVVSYMKERSRKLKEKRGERIGKLEEEGRWQMDNYEIENKDTSRESDNNAKNQSTNITELNIDITEPCSKEDSKELANNEEKKYTESISEKGNTNNLEINKLVEEPEDKARKDNCEDNFQSDKQVNQSVNQMKIEKQESKEIKQPKKNSPLPMSASFASVCHVATQLMKHCLGIELFECAVLVGEAVALYQKARIGRRNERFRKRSTFESNQRRHELIAIRGESYDKIDNDSEDSSEDSDVILSDDNEVDDINDKTLLASLSRGALPPELQTLYALSLIGKGGKDFFAWKLMTHVIPQLEVESPKAVEEDLFDTEIVADSTWVLFRRAAIAPLRRTQAFVVLSDLIKKIGKEEEWAKRLARGIQIHFKTLEANNDLLALRPKDSQESPSHSLMRNQQIKLILALARMHLYEAKRLLAERGQKHDFETKNRYINQKRGTGPGKLALTVIELMVRFRHVLWKNALKDGSLQQNSLDMLQLLSGAFPIVMESKSSEEKDDIKHETLFDLLAKLKHFISSICKTNVGSAGTSNDEILDIGDSFPVSHEWQNSSHEKISLRTYNLCVGCNVSAFSGWEKNEFSLDHLQKNDRPTYFGIKIGGEHVSGFLPEAIELDLSFQWRQIESLISSAPLLDFDSSLYMAKQAAWYKNSVARLKKFKDTKIASNGEEHALYLLLTYSRLCLEIASKDKNMKEEMLKEPLSIVIPMTQYCLDQRIWDSPVGTEAATSDGPEEWEKFIRTMTDIDGNLVEHDDSIPTISHRLHKNLRSSSRSSKKNLLNYIPPSRKRTYPKVVAIPVTDLLKKWKDTSEKSEENQPSDIDSVSLEAMKKLDIRMKQLRSCFTVQALQRISVHVAAALLDVAGVKACYNPFLCLHQAAMFAGQGSKGGSSDAPFKKLLPPKSTCTELEALIILGRADCMRALAFTDQAMFLCSFVAEVCRLHRDERKHEYRWNSRWVVIGIQMYTVSMAIDKTIDMMDSSDARKTSLLDWDDEVKAEIERGKADAISVYKLCNVKSRTKNMVNTVSDIKDTGAEQDYSSDDQAADNEVVTNTWDTSNNDAVVTRDVSIKTTEALHIEKTNHSSAINEEGFENDSDDDAISIAVVAV